MRIVVPISRADVHLLPEFVELHQHLRSAGLNHSLHFVVPSTLQGEAHDAKAALDGLFEEIKVHPMDFEPYGGWPFGPNMHFYACANAMRLHNKAIPWQLVELDCRPIRANAYDVIAAKYASCGAPFFGYVGPTPWRDREPYLLDPMSGRPTGVKNPNYGKIVKSPEGPSDVMMSGCAVYPGDILDRPNLAGLMADFMKGSESIEKPWDMHLRAAMLAEGMAHTELIANHWNTEKYRIENGRLLCDAREEHETYEQNPEWEKRPCGGYIHPDAVMVHGCKDDSLVTLIINGGIPDSFAGAPAPKAVQPQNMEEKFYAPPPPQDDPRIAALEESMKQQMAMMAAIQQSLMNLAAPIEKPVPKKKAAA
jgi:hypothetical protein